jgi:hypothetical protein
MTQPPPADDDIADRTENDEPAPGWWTVSRRRQGRNEGVGFAPGGMVGASLQHGWASGLDFAPADGSVEPDYYLDPGPAPARHRRPDDDEMPVPAPVLVPAAAPVAPPAVDDLDSVAPPAVDDADSVAPPAVGDVDYRGDEETDPIGFAPVSGPPSDPFYSRAVPDDDPDPGFILPGWGAPPPDVEERIGRVQRARKPLLVVGLALFLAGLITAILFAPRLVGAGEPTEAAALPGAGAGVGRPAVTSIRGAVDGVTEATFDLVDGAGSVRMRAAALGTDLYRVTTPTGSDVAPRIDRDGGTLKLYLPHGSKGAPDEVDIVLNAGIRWTLRLDGGAEHKTVDLTAATVEAVDLGGGARTIELALPAPKGRMPVRMAGGVDQFRVSLPGATPVRVRVQSGAGAVTLPGSTYRGIAPGRSFTANGWGSGARGVDVLAEAGMATLTVTAA